MNPPNGRDRDDLGPVLADAMAELQPYEPNMPDLLGPAMAEGTRIRRRRRTTLLVALSTAVALAAGGVAGGLKYVGGSEGRGTGPATSPTDTGTENASSPARTPSEELAEALRRHLQPYGITLTTKPWGHSVETDSEVIVTLVDHQGAHGAITLSAGRTKSTLPTELTNANCEIPAQVDQTRTADYGREDICKMYRAGLSGAAVWAVVARNTSGTATNRIGAVRLGPEREVARVWTYDAQPSGASPGQLRLDTQLLIDLVADPKVSAAVTAVAALPGGLPSPPPAWPVDAPDKYASQSPTATKPTTKPAAASAGASRRPTG